MSEEVQESLSDKSMGELVELLTDNEIAQLKIQNDYLRAASLDLEMKKLKKRETLIRAFISSKIGAV